MIARPVHEVGLPGTSVVTRAALVEELSSLENIPVEESSLAEEPSLLKRSLVEGPSF
jgi:hypothetical protein